MEKYLNIKRIVALCLTLIFSLYNTSLVVLAASEISVGGPLPTDTNINWNGSNIYDIQTNTSVSNGTIGINSFDKFNVGQGDTVNLNLINAQNKLVNLIFDSSASQINGIVNSYMNGQIGGNVLFANPNGFVVGANGVFNVGSLTLMTPTEDSMRDLINFDIHSNAQSWNETNAERLISFTFNDANYLVAGNEYHPFVLAPGTIDISGVVNSSKGIDLFSGGTVNLQNGSELNANMSFTKDAAGKITAAPSENVLVSELSGDSYPKNLAMQNGNNIVIVSSNNDASADVLSAIVNLDGNVKANGSSVYVRTEVFQTDKAGNTESQITVKGNADISGNDIVMQAVSQLTSSDKNLIDISDSAREDYYGYAGELVNVLGENFVHIANVTTKVTVEKSATLTAINDIVLEALSDMEISAHTYSAALAFNYTSIDAVTEAVIKSGANISAANLDVAATTDLELSTASKATSMLDEKIHNKYGNIAGNLTLEEISNRAVIENGVNLNVTDNLSVIANTVSNHVDTTKNGIIPIIDKNRGVVGAAVSVIIADVNNEAVLNSDVNLVNGGVVNVTADYTGKISSAVTAYAGGEGENTSGKSYAITFVKALVKGSGTNGLTALQDKAFDSMKARGNADFSNLDIAGAVAVAINEVNSTAKIGDADNNIKPSVTAGTVNVSSTLIDNKSDLSAVANTENGKTTVSGALAINYKDLNSDATVYSDIVINNSELNFTTSSNNIFTGNFYQKNDTVSLVDEDYYNSLDNNKKENYRIYTGALYKDADSNILTEYEYNLIPDDEKSGYSPYTGTMYQSVSNLDLISEEQYNKLSDNTKALYSKLDTSDITVYGYGHYDEAKLKFTTDADKKIEYTLANEGTYYKNASGDIISENKYNSLTEEAKQGCVVYEGKVYSSDTMGNAAVSINSDTEIRHPLSYYDWWPEFANMMQSMFSSEYWNFAGNEVKNSWNDLETNSSTDYLAKLASVSELSHLMDDLSLDMILYGVANLDNLGLASLFNTYAQSTSEAKTTTGETKAVAGAIAVGVFDASANALLFDNSSITINKNTGNTDTNINAYSNNEIWTMGTLIKPFNVKSGLAGMTARDGSAYGAGVGFSFSDSDTTAKVGKNVSITNNNTDKQNDLVVNAESDGNFVNVTAASSSADDAGMSGSIGATVVTGDTIAAIESSDTGKSINVKDAKVNADKDANYINGIIVFANSQEATGWGIASTTLTDAVKAYIGGNINAANDVSISGNYDKLLVNVSTNVGIAQKGTEPPKGSAPNPASSWLQGTFLDDLIIGQELAEYEGYKQESLSRTKTIKSKMNKVEEYLNRDFDFERASAPDKSTAAYAGIINAVVTTNKVESYIADGAKIDAGNNVSVTANQSDTLIDAGIVTAANGKTGVGATVMADVIANDTRASIGNAIVDANKNILVSANQNTLAVAASAGVAQAKDSSGVGNLSSIVQVNDVTADIKNGAQINQNKKSNTQSVDVKANMESLTGKGAGALSIQTGGSGSGEGTSVGATLDGDVVVNTIRASIDGAKVNASDYINVEANNNDRFIGVDAAGSVSTQGAAYGGLIAAYVAANSIDAYINNSTINASGADINVNANSDFREIVVAGTVAAGNKTGVGATVRTDVVINEMNSYIKDSTVTAKNVELTNNEQLHQISVAVAGAGSSTSSAGAGVANVFADVTTQNNYIDNSTLNINSLSLDTDKTLFDVAVTGAIAAAVGSSGASVGASAYGVGVSHNINTYIKNSDIISTNDITLTSDFIQDMYTIVFGGAGGSGVTASGALSVLVNDSNVNTYVLSDQNKKNKLHSTSGAVNIKSTNDIYTLTVDGNVGISTGSVSAGGAVNTTVYDSDITAGIDGADIIAKNGIDVLAKAAQTHLSTIVGASGGTSVSVQGSVDTLIMSQNMDAYIKNAVIKSDGDIKVNAEDVLDLTSIAGAAAVSTGGGSVGGSILTVTMTGENKAHIDNTTFDKYQTALGELLVKATQSDKFTGATISGSVGTFSVAGTIDTIVINKDIAAYVDGLQNLNNSKFKNTEVNAHTATELGHGTGQVSAGYSGAGVGGAIGTLVLNKNVSSEIKNSTLNSSGYLKNLSSADIDIISVALGFGGSSGAAVNGTVVTQVLNVDTSSLINNSIVSAIGELINTSTNDTNLDMYLASANGAGTAAVGGVVYSLVDNSTANAIINGGTNITSAGSLTNTANIISKYLVTLFNASGAGTAAVNGTVSTLVLNSAANALIDASTIANTGAVTVSSDNNSDAMIVMLQASGSGAAAVNGGVNTFVSSKKSKAEINNSTISSQGNINVNADADNKIDSTVAGGAGSGAGAITGSVNTIVSSDEITAKISNSSVTTTVPNAQSGDSGVVVAANDNLEVVGRTGSAAGAGAVAVGGSIITGVITNNVSAEVNNSDISAANADIVIKSAANEVVGDSSNPFITIAGTGSGASAVSGAVDTLVFSSSSKALVSGKKSNGLIAGDKLVLNSTGDTELFVTSGAASGAGGVSVGATVSTLVINKDIEAVAENTELSVSNIDIDTKAEDNITNVVVAGSGAGTAGVAGAVNTTVVSSTLKSGVKNSVISTNNMTVDTTANADYDNITGGVAGAGVAGVGASVATNVIGYNAEAFVDNSNLKGINNNAKASSLKVNANVNSNYDLYAVSGAGGGVAGVGGVILTDVVNNTVKSYVTGNSSGINLSTLEVKASDTVNFNGIAGALAVGSVGVGATIQTNSVTSTVLSYTGGVVNADDIDVSTIGVQNFNDLLVMGFGGGQVAVNGSSLANIVEATTKAYIADNSNITANTDLDVIANNTTTITESVGSGAVAQYAAVGATVAVNKITNTVESYTGSNVKINAKSADFNAVSTNNLGTSNNELILIAGSGAAGGALAGSVLVNTVEDSVKSYIGTNNNIILTDDLNIEAQADTNIYETVGGYAVAGVAGVGASVGVNTIYNTVIASVGSGSVIDMELGDLSIVAQSNETVRANANVVGGGSVALSGGILHNTIGKSVGNAEANDLTEEDAEAYNSAKSQADEVLLAANSYKNEADDTFKTYYNDAASDVDDAISDANKNIEDSLGDGLNASIDPNGSPNQDADEIITDANAKVTANNIEKKDSAFSLFTKSSESGSNYGSTDRDYTTSAFVDTGAKIKAKSITVNANDVNNVNIDVNGNTYGGAAVGVAAGVSNVNTTVNAFVSNNAVLETVNGTQSNISAEDSKIEISANSTDNQNVNVSAAAGGIIGGSGAIAKINSNKTTNAYILKSSILNALGDLLLNTNSTGIANSVVSTGAYGGLTVGVSVADAIIKGNTRIDIGEDVSLASNSGDVTIETDSVETATADASAAAGSLVGGSGAEVKAEAGKDTSINIGKSIGILAGEGNIAITSGAENSAIAESDGRAYGVVSAGGTKTKANVNHIGGVKIADTVKKANDNIISGNSVNISSTADNSVNAKTNAGAGAAVGISGSGVVTNINSDNEVYVGSNYDITTTAGEYITVASNTNTYSAYNDSSAYGAVGVTAGTIDNTVSSIVKAVSNANVNANGPIEVFANNAITKAASSNYDLYGGAGGIVGVGAAVLEDNIIANTYAALGGSSVKSTGANNSGYINISSQSIVDINEKVDVTSGGAIPAADGDVSVKTDITTKTEISAKDIQTKDDDIYYLANSDVNIYTKANIESYGGIAVATGDSIAKNINSNTSVLIKKGVNSVSGRDTYIQSTGNKDIQAYIYATTKGLIGAVGGSQATALNNSSSNIIIEADSAVKSYDSMNLSALDSTDNITAKRTAKGTTYILFGIPITIYGSGNETKENNSNATITLNGALESGLGANKSLTINKDGTWESNGINVIGKEVVGQVTASDISSDIEIYKGQKELALQDVDEMVETLNTNLTNYEAAYNNAKTSVDSLTEINKTYNTAKTNADTIIANNTAIGNIDAVTAAWGNAYDETTSSVADSFGGILASYSTDENISDVINAWNAYSADKSAANLTVLQTAVGNLAVEKADLQSSNNTLASSITSTDAGKNIDINNNSQLGGFKNSIDILITQNNATIETAKETMSNALEQIDKTNEQIELAAQEKINITNTFDAEIANLEEQMASASKDAINIYSIIIDDVYVRSGETNIAGNVTGTGSITAPGNKFSINIENNSVSDIVYNDLQIGRNVTGGINGGNIDSSIRQTIKNQDADYSISITNTVDANDPTINLNNGFGDMVFYGDLENVKGTINLTNYTGNILSEGSMTAKNLKIAVPNGGYTQDYSTNTTNIGGTDGTGAIVASGDIDIAAKIINVNGLIQSGSEIKAVTIPDFTVVKEGDTYYQVVNGVKTAMTPGTTEGYYYLNLEGNGELDSELELIKAYFKPSDSSNANNVQGEIYLFKAEIGGGNITLTGNIVSDSNTGKIVLVNGYGHIDIENNSNFNLVTSALNADTKVEGKLTINDFKLSEGGDTTFDNITQDDLTDNYLKQHAGQYTAYVDKNGKIVTTTSGQTNGNGQWGSQSSSTRNDGANINNISYTPGNDAYIVTEAGYEEEKSYQVYVKRSWWTELWHGKLYKTVYYTVVHEPVYGVANNSIQVQFQGFDTPEINVTSNGSIVMNNSISALNGDINLTSNNGSITTNSINNVISGTNIDLSALKGDVGSELRPIQTAVFNEGTLQATGNNVYINYPYSDISNLIINAVNTAYVATSNNNIGSNKTNVDIKADSLELMARNGSIDLDSTTNKNINVDVNKVKARANGDISITNKNDLNVSSIVSESKGTITLGSENGSINAVDTDAYSPYHINGGNVILNAVNGSIGTTDKGLKVANDGIYKVNAKGDVNIDSAGRIYADLIKSETGAVNLNADFGIIASESSDDLVYNIYSAKDVNLTTGYGNIENIGINTDGVVNASAGYSGTAVSNLSDISISLISKEELSQEYLNSLSSDAEREQAYNSYTNGLKDMKIGTINATQNVIIHSEKAILNENTNSSITGEKIVLSAGNGDIGEADSAINLTANRNITAFAGDGQSVYLTTSDETKGLNINEIRANVTLDSTTGTVTSSGSLANVVLTSAGNILNDSENSEAANIIADNITLNSDKNIGALTNCFNVETSSDSTENGLKYEAQNAYINGMRNDLSIVSSNIDGDSFITTDDGINAVIQNTVVGGELTVESQNNILVNSAEVSGDSTFTGESVNIVNADLKQNANITSASKTTINNATIGNDLTSKSEELEITGKVTTVGDADIDADNSVTIADADIKGNADVNSAVVNITNANVEKDANITSNNKTTIGNAVIGNNFTSISEDLEVTGKVTTVGDADIDADNSVTIADADIKGNADVNSAVVNITNANVEKDANITSNNKTTIGNAVIGNNLTSISEDLEVTGKVTTGGDADINADSSVTIADADIKGNADINANNIITIQDADITGDLIAAANDIIIDEINLAGNINANVDNLSINSSNDINIGTIQGNTSQYTNNAVITTDKSILNGLDTNEVNMYVQSVDLTAGDKISTSEKPLNIMLTNGNKLSMTSGNSIAISTSGSSAHYSKIETDNFELATENDINIEEFKVNNAQLNTTANNINIDKMQVENNAVLETANKRIVVNNTSLQPIIDADVQMTLNVQPTSLKIDSSNNIITDSRNVVRHNGYIQILTDSNYNSMNSAINSSGAANMKNTNVGEKTIEKTDKLLYTISTAHNYVQSVIGDIIGRTGKQLVKTYYGDVVTPKNIFDTINTSVLNQIYNVNQKKELSENSEDDKLGLL